MKMRNPIIDCMAKEFVEELMYRGDSVSAEEVFTQLPLEHFNLTENDEEDILVYIADLIDDLAEEYDYALCEGDENTYVPEENNTHDYNDDEEFEEDSTDEDDEEHDTNLYPEDDEDDSDDWNEDEDYNDENENIVFNTANSNGQLTIPAKFIQELDATGKPLIYACYGSEVLIFPETSRKLVNMVKKEKEDGTVKKVISYTPHWTHGYYEARRSVNKLFDNLPDASDEKFQIELDTNEGTIHVFRA